MIDAHLIGDKILSSSADAFSFNDRSRLGEKKEENIEFTFIEALFLLSEKKMILYSNKKIISFHDLIKIAKKQDKRIQIKFTIYKDLRRKGYIVKTALKFGADFRVYEKGIKPGEDHAKWILFAAKEQENLSWQDFAAKNRIAHSTKKDLLLGIVDEEDDVSYYQVSWIRT